MSSFTATFIIDLWTLVVEARNMCFDTACEGAILVPIIESVILILCYGHQSERTFEAYS